MGWRAGPPRWWCEAFSINGSSASARIEHRGEDVLFAVAEQAPKVWWCGAGLAAQLPGFIRSNPPRRLFVVNVEKIMLDMRERAKRAGFDLSGGSFFLPPDHELYQQWLKEFRRAAFSGAGAVRSLGCTS